MFGLIAFGNPAWPIRSFGRVVLATVLLGVGYTIFSEWLNIVVRKSWAYSSLMPVVSLFGLNIGVSPLLQWMAVPALALYAARRAGGRTDKRAEVIR